MLDDIFSFDDSNWNYSKTEDVDVSRVQFLLSSFAKPKVKEND